MSGRRTWLILVSLAVLSLSIAPPALAHTNAPASAPKLVPTSVCGCQSAVTTGSTPHQFRGPPSPPSGNVYDEQLGMTFTQSFTSIEYNVTAVAQTDATLGTGPAYLLNGLSNVGYWYQVGVSWNWSPGDNPGTGFDMNYEVFNPGQISVFPSNGGGGVDAFSGTVNQGDLVTLNLYFNKTANQVVMQAVDTATNAFASETYTAAGGSVFAGMSNNVANSNGYFTGLMNEWYHGLPYYANGAQVTFSDSQFALTSAWLWVDEFNANSLKGLFSANTPSPLVFSNPNTLQKFSYNGTLEFADAYEFITGNASSSTTNTIPLTVSYSVVGGGTGFTPPVLTYSSNGSKTTATLSTSATQYHVDQGSTWNVTAQLTGSSVSERWETDQSSTGVAKSAQSVNLVYYHQFLVNFAFSVSGGGSGYLPPGVTYYSFGVGQTVAIPSSSQPTKGEWADSASRFNYTATLGGSGAAERWASASTSGPIAKSGQVTIAYYHQYLVTVNSAFKGGEIFPTIAIRSTSEGVNFTGTVILGTNAFWLDANSQYTMPQTISLSQGNRWTTNATATGVVTGQLAIPLTYQYEYLVGFGSNVPAGGTLSAASGWYLPGASIQATATPESGWQAEGWTGMGAASVSTSGAVLSLMVSGPVNETAVFYPGITVTDNGPISVSYQDGSASGTVASGKSITVYVPPQSTLTLTASAAPFLYSFEGWSGAGSSTQRSLLLSVSGPAVVVASSSYNYLVLALILLAIVVVLLVAIVAARSRRRTAGLRQEETLGSPAA